MIEVRSNITQNLNKGCRLWQQPRLESELLETKQRSFWFDVSRWNQVSRMETQQSRIECQLTFERYGSLCSFNDYSSSPNGLLTQSPWGWEEWVIVLVKSNYLRQNNYSWLKLDFFNPFFLPPKSQHSSLLVGYNILPCSSSSNQHAALIVHHSLDFTNKVIQ